VGHHLEVDLAAQLGKQAANIVDQAIELCEPFQQARHTNGATMMTAQASFCNSGSDCTSSIKAIGGYCEEYASNPTVSARSGPQAKANMRISCGSPALATAIAR
jgi:hypothetical protein